MHIKYSALNWFVKLNLHTVDATIDMSYEDIDSLLDMMSEIYSAIAYKLWRGTYDLEKCNLLLDEKLSIWIKELQHHKDSTVWLYATDRPDLIPDEIKSYFFKIK